jgi:hypothetical protein
VVFLGSPCDRAKKLEQNGIRFLAIFSVFSLIILYFVESFRHGLCSKSFCCISEYPLLRNAQKINKSGVQGDTGTEAIQPVLPRFWPLI